MKIKYLAIALLSTTLIASPLLAKDKVKPVKTVKEMDKSSPKAASAIPPSITALEVTAPNQTKGLSIASDKVETKSSKAYIKIDDIKGESQDRAAETISPDRIEFKKAIATPDLDTDSDDGDDADSNPATDYNSSRSNKADNMAAPNPDDSDDESIEKTEANHNTSRSVIPPKNKGIYK